MKFILIHSYSFTDISFFIKSINSQIKTISVFEKENNIIEYTKSPISIVINFDFTEDHEHFVFNYVLPSKIIDFNHVSSFIYQPKIIIFCSLFYSINLNINFKFYYIFINFNKELVNCSDSNINSVSNTLYLNKLYSLLFFFPKLNFSSFYSCNK